MKIGDMQKRGCDQDGCGHFDAPRGTRRHNGYDLLCDPGETICSPIHGTVTKVGYPYADDLSFRYVQVSAGEYDFRLFYVEPSVAVGQTVTPDTVIGTGQNLGERYDGIANHIHFEIKRGADYIDPTPVLIALGVTV